MYFTPEREFVQQSIAFSQKQVDGKVEALAYKGNVIIVGRSSETSNLYSEEESSMVSKLRRILRTEANTFDAGHPRYGLECRGHHWLHQRQRYPYLQVRRA
jgi:argininosuccinate synthase